MELHYLNLALQASVDAGLRIMQFYSNSIAVQQKTDFSPVTQADLAANDVLIERLNQTPFPIISEESTPADYHERQHYQTVWIIDPLDGTKDFIKRTGEFGVNIALIHNGSPLLGIIYLPALDELFWGGKNMGAFTCRNASQQNWLTMQAYPASAQPLPSEELPEMYTFLSSRSTPLQVFENYLLEKNQNHPFLVTRLGSALKFCRLAQRQAHAYPRFEQIMEWDIAAGHALLEGAGGQMLHLYNHQPIFYNTPSLRAPLFCAFWQLGA